MSKRIKYRPLDSFRPFHNTEMPKKCVFGGYGSGKTYSLCHELLKLCNLNPRLPGGLVVPNMKMFKRDVLPTLIEIAERNRFSFSYRKGNAELFFPQTGSTVYIFHGEDKGQNIRGPNLAFMVLNEVTLLDLETYQAALSRVRHPRATRRCVAMSGTFEGATEIYDAITEDDSCFVSYASTRDNHFMPADFIQLLESSYDEDMVQQYVDGIPVISRSRKFANEFLRTQHVIPTPFFIEYDIMFTIDFNVDPMAVVLWQRVPGIEEGAEFRAFQEMKIMDSNTDEMAKAVKKRIEELIGPFDPGMIPCYPDPAGNSRTTKGVGKSDIATLKENGFTDVRFRRKAPHMRDAKNAVNRQFRRNNIQIDPSCKEFIKDLERVEVKPGTDSIDKSDLNRTHWLDGFKYMIELEYPIKKFRGQWRQQQVR